MGLDDDKAIVRGVVEEPANVDGESNDEDNKDDGDNTNEDEGSARAEAAGAAR